MNTSQEIGKIAEALAAAQAELKNPIKDRTAKIAGQKAAFSYTYADFATALEDIRPVLSKNKIALAQATAWNGQIVMLSTRLLHASGEWIESEYPVGGIADHRTMGSALSYARRYALMSLIGVQGEDDDDGHDESEHARRSVNSPPEHKLVETRSEPASQVPSSAMAARMIESIQGFGNIDALNAWVGNNRDVYNRLNAGDQASVSKALKEHRTFLAQAPSEAA